MGVEHRALPGDPRAARLNERLAAFSRLIAFDKRGMGLSDHSAARPRWKERMDDLCAVMDTVGSERAALLGYWEGGPMSALFAATHRERVTALILYGTMDSYTRAGVACR